MVAVICITVIGSAAISTSLIVIGQVRDEYEHELKKARHEIEENKKTIYVALADIGAGDILSEDNVGLKIVYSSQAAESYITARDIGKTAVIDIPEGTHVVKAMLAESEVSQTLREVEYDVIYISPNIAENEYVDVRIIYPNGESYIVLTKKSLKGLQQGTPVCYMWVDEEEFLRMSAAIVDAGLYDGSRLLAIKYIEPSIQDKAVITYVPNISVLSLIESDPNIVEKCSQKLNKEVRKALENRLAQTCYADVRSVRWDVGDIYGVYTSSTTGIENRNENNEENDISDGEAVPAESKSGYDEYMVPATDGQNSGGHDNNGIDTYKDEDGIYEYYFPELGALEKYHDDNIFYAARRDGK